VDLVRRLRLVLGLRLVPRPGLSLRLPLGPGLGSRRSAGACLSGPLGEGCCLNRYLSAGGWLNRHLGAGGWLSGPLGEGWCPNRYLSAGGWLKRYPGGDGWMKPTLCPGGDGGPTPGLGGAPPGPGRERTGPASVFSPRDVDRSPFQSRPATRSLLLGGDVVRSLPRDPVVARRQPPRRDEIQSLLRPSPAIRSLLPGRGDAVPDRAVGGPASRAGAGPGGSAGWRPAAASSWPRRPGWWRWSCSAATGRCTPW
jgi:hypothetical protein